jgi:hypothetical protein
MVRGLVVGSRFFFDIKIGPHDDLAHVKRAICAACSLPDGTAFDLHGAPPEKRDSWANGVYSEIQDGSPSTFDRFITPLTRVDDSQDLSTHIDERLGNMVQLLVVMTPTHDPHNYTRTSVDGAGIPGGSDQALLVDTTVASHARAAARPITTAVVMLAFVMLAVLASCASRLNPTSASLAAIAYCTIPAVISFSLSATLAPGKPVNAHLQLAAIPFASMPLVLVILNAPKSSGDSQEALLTAFTYTFPLFYKCMVDAVEAFGVFA